MDRDRNLLFGVLAVQLRKVTPTQLVDIAGAWATDPSRSLGDRLLEAKIVSPEDKKLLDGLVDQAINTFGGDVSKTLQAFGGEEEINRSFQGSILLTEKGVETRPMSGVPIEEVETIPAVQESPGRYSQISEYGRGGMGRVLLVHDQYLGREVALKELLLPVNSKTNPGNETPVRISMQMMARFLQESRITGQLEHPAIVPVYELGHRKDGTLYYTMKLVRGRTLTKAIKEAGSLQERLALLPHFVDLCQAIAYAHSRGVIHRDIKPDNVMVGEFGETVVLDWGLAKAEDHQDVHADGLAETLRAMNLGDETEVVNTAYGHAIGTPAYMPPEQAQGKLECVNERSDVYSLGAVLYEILSGCPPFDGRNLFAILNKVINEEPPDIVMHDPRAPIELEAICKRAMCKDSKKRYKSPLDLALDIQNFLTGALVSAHHYGIINRIQRFVHRHRNIFNTVGVSSIFLLIIVGLVLQMQIFLSRREGENKLLIHNQYDEMIDTASEYIDSNDYAQAESILLKGNYNDKTHPIEFKQYANWEYGYLCSKVMKVPAHSIPGTLTSSDISVFTPSGDALLVASPEGGFNICNALTLETLGTMGTELGQVVIVRCSSDNKYFLAVGTNGVCQVYHTINGTPIFPSDSVIFQDVRDARFSQTGRYIVLWYRSSIKPPVIWDSIKSDNVPWLGDISVPEQFFVNLYTNCFGEDDSCFVYADINGKTSSKKSPAANIMTEIDRLLDLVGLGMFSWEYSYVAPPNLPETSSTYVYSLNENKRITRIDADYSSFHPDGKTLICLKRQGEIASFNTVFHRLTWHTIFERLQYCSMDNVSVQFSPNGQRFLVYLDGGTLIQMYERDNHSVPKIINKGGKNIKVADFSSDSQRLLVITLNNQVTIWNSVTARKLVSLSGKMAAFSPNSKVLYITSPDNVTTRLSSEEFERYQQISNVEKLTM